MVPGSSRIEDIFHSWKKVRKLHWRNFTGKLKVRWVGGTDKKQVEGPQFHPSLNQQNSTQGIWLRKLKKSCHTLPVISSSLSASVLFPWSTWAIMLKLRMFSTGNWERSTANWNSPPQKNQGTQRSTIYICRYM
jgi:hypothetical protein